MTLHRMALAELQGFYKTEHFTLGHFATVFQEEEQDSSAMYRLLAVE